MDKDKRRRARDLVTKLISYDAGEEPVPTGFDPFNYLDRIRSCLKYSRERTVGFRTTYVKRHYYASLMNKVEYTAQVDEPINEKVCEEHSFSSIFYDWNDPKIEHFKSLCEEKIIKELKRLALESYNKAKSNQEVGLNDQPKRRTRRTRGSEHTDNIP